MTLKTYQNIYGKKILLTTLSKKIFSIDDIIVHPKTYTIIGFISAKKEVAYTKNITFHNDEMRTEHPFTPLDQCADILQIIQSGAFFISNTIQSTETPYGICTDFCFEPNIFILTSITATKYILRCIPIEQRIIPIHSIEYVNAKEIRIKDSSIPLSSQQSIPV